MGNVFAPPLDNFAPTIATQVAKINVSPINISNYGSKEAKQ